MKKEKKERVGPPPPPGGGERQSRTGLTMVEEIPVTSIFHVC